MDTSVKKVLLLFKTHLDVGYTDYAKNVINDYIQTHIPSAIRLARELKESGRSERFVWTVGSWMIDHYLELSDKTMQADMERAIREGDISYHALPFTTHTEAMDAELFRYGLSIAKTMDTKFSKDTIAGKVTDVPGHTKAMIPYLTEAGIKLLHIGVNPASMPPDVPDFFIWHYDDNNEVVVVYNKGYYGEAARIPGTDTVIHFAHTNDNCGPQNVEDVIEIYDEIRAQYPNAAITATDLNGMAEAVLAVKDSLPVVTEEMGDTWIHGVGTDPRKVSGYRSLLRLRSQFSETDRRKMEKHLLLVPEHTWGMCEMKFLDDHDTFTKEALQNEISTEKYRRFIVSWDEQRQYVTNAVESLDGETKQAAEQALAEYKINQPDISHYDKLPKITDVTVGGYTVSFDDTGALCAVSFDGESILDDSMIGKFMYEVFGSEDFKRFQKQYNTHDFDWALEDFGKIGCEKVLQKGKRFNAALANLYRRDTELLAELSMPEEAYTQYGCPRKVFVSYQFRPGKIEIDLSWFKKDANRLGEALWLSFAAPHQGCFIRKLGKWLDTQKVISNGGRALHASDYGVRLPMADGHQLEIESLDAALFAPSGPSLLNFTNQLPESSGEISVNLYNNIWGTNFPMWYSEDARFRFVITI